MDARFTFLQQISAEHTRRAYRVDLERFFGEADIDDSDLETVTTAMIQSFVRSMHERGRSESTQRRRIAALRRFFDWAVESGIRTTNPVRARQIGPIADSEAQTRTRALSKQNIRDLLDVAGRRARSGRRDQALILTIVYAALRRSEIAGLCVDDVRPLGRHWVIDLPGSTSSAGGYVRVPEVVIDTIEEMKAEYEIDDGALWRSVSNRNLGEPMSPDAIYKVVRSVGEDAEIDGVTIDRLRRTGLHLALRGGADVPTVQAHGRLKSASTAAALHENDDASGTLRKSAADFIDLQLDDLIQAE